MDKLHPFSDKEISVATEKINARFMEFMDHGYSLRTLFGEGGCRFPVSCFWGLVYFLAAYPESRITEITDTHILFEVRPGGNTLRHTKVDLEQLEEDLRGEDHENKKDTDTN